MIKSERQKTLFITRERLTTELKKVYDEIIDRLDAESSKTGIKKHYLILKWLLEGAKNG